MFASWGSSLAHIPEGAIVDADDNMLADADDAFLDAEEPTDLFEDEVCAQKKSVPLVRVCFWYSDLAPTLQVMSRQTA